MGVLSSMTMPQHKLQLPKVGMVESVPPTTESEGLVTYGHIPVIRGVATIKANPDSA